MKTLQEKTVKVRKDLIALVKEVAETTGITPDTKWFRKKILPAMEGMAILEKTVNTFVSANDMNIEIEDAKIKIS